MQPGKISLPYAFAMQTSVYEKKLEEKTETEMERNLKSILFSLWMCKKNENEKTHAIFVQFFVLALLRCNSIRNVT